MNIIIRLFDNDRFCFRPDTTWERENRDFFSPDFMSRIFFTPVIFARISRAGKCIGRKFAGRYYDASNFGMLMYNGDILEENLPDSVAFASMADRTSILPFPLYNPEVMTNENNRFRLSIDGRCVFSCLSAGVADKIGNAVCKASEIISLRTGDMVAVELDAPKEIISGGNSRICVDGSFCENEIFRFDIIR